MGCEFINLGNGVSAIVCSRGAKRCKCGNRVTKLCDYPLAGKLTSKTCDMPMCERCAVHVGDNKDYCQVHARATGVSK